MSNLSVVRQQNVSGTLQVQSMDDVARLSKMLCESRFFDDCKDAAQAGVKVIAGMELGIPAMAAMTGIFIVKGKVSIGANIMAAMIKRSGKYNYRVLEHTESVCKIAFFEGSEQVGISEFSASDAAKLGTQNMNKFPRNMLFARAISNGIKWHCPDLFLGAPVYTPDELGATVDEDGQVIEADASPVVRSTPVKTIASDPIESVLDGLTILPSEIDELGVLTGCSRAQVFTIAANLQINPNSMTHSQWHSLREGLLGAWAFEQGGFKAKVHAFNAVKKILLPSMTNQECFDAVAADVAARKTETVEVTA